jgi:hypothetical protein
LYDNPAGIVIYAQAPQRSENALVGRFVFSLEYEFSGRRDPLGPEALPFEGKHASAAVTAIKEPQEPIANKVPPKPPAGEHNDMYAQFLKFKSDQ